MIPIGIGGLIIFLIFISTSAIGVLLIIFWISYYRKKSRKAKLGTPSPVKKMHPIFLTFIFLLTLLFNSFNAYIIYAIAKMEYEDHKIKKHKDKRSRLVLSESVKIDEFTFPKGTLVNLHDVYDEGDEIGPPFNLSGLRRARFTHPVKIAGIWTHAYEYQRSYAIRLELSKDQIIGPIVRNSLQYASSPHETRHGETSTVLCKQGQIARFKLPQDYYPDTRYSIENWNTRPDPVFKPSLWILEECQDNGPIVVDPAYPAAKLVERYD